ncbi:cupin domain-containing protein [Paraburkholderia sp. SIMBA_049]
MSNVAARAGEPSADPNHQQITQAGTQPSATGPAAFFTGRVRVAPLSAANDSINASSAYVTFEPGARSAWHTHPTGQYLVVTSGVGLTQEWGKPIQTIRPGDVVWCPPGVKHWHGATPATAMTHLAITGTAYGKNVNWMEKVSDEQYNVPEKPVAP